MAHTLFISDLHLSESHPHTTELFLRFAREIAPQADALYILGDLFEYWAGDDDLDTAFHRQVCSALAALADHSTALYIMHGNRDFLMDEALAAACKARIIDDPLLVDLYGTTTLLSHGDSLCTEDSEYQQFRAMARTSEWKSGFLSHSLAQRKKLIEGGRTKSAQSKQDLDEHIMDVTEAAVQDLLRKYAYPRLIHGHTHRPAKHIHNMDGHSCERWVLGDWDTQANALQVSSTGIQQLTFS